MVKDEYYSLECKRIFEFFDLMGHKWACRLFVKLEPGKLYRFEDIVQAHNRKIHRSLLSKHLKQFIEKGIITKHNNLYYLTPKGVKIKNKLFELREILVDNSEP